MQSDINKELKASIASASGKTYSKSEIDSNDAATLTSAKSYADTKKTEAVSAAATDATTKANSALASAKSYADQKVSALGSVYTDSQWLKSIGFVEDTNKDYILGGWLVITCEHGKWNAYSVKSSHWHYLCAVALREDVTRLVAALKLNA